MVERLSDLQIAQVAHEAVRALCFAAEIPESPDSWPELAAGDINANAATVAFIRTHPRHSIVQMHNDWMNSMTRRGYTHGERNDQVARTHPLLLPYTELPASYRLQNRLFFAVVSALLPPPESLPVQLSGALPPPTSTSSESKSL
jgi:hypothetical protein